MLLEFVRRGSVLHAANTNERSIQDFALAVNEDYRVLWSIMKQMIKEIKKALVSYLRTQFVIMIVVTVLSWMLLSSLRVRFSLLLAFITGALTAVPIAGMVTSAIITSLVATFDRVRFISNGPEFIEGIVIIVLYLIFNGLVDLLISPYVARKFTRLHPVVVFCGVLIGSALFGFLGAFLAVPVLLVGRTVWLYYFNRS